MDAVLALVFLGALMLPAYGYQTYLKRSILPRVFVTSLSQETLDELFEQYVCTTGWKLLTQPGDNPMVAQSPRWAGLTGALMPQEISLLMESADGGKTRALIWPTRFVRKTYGTPVRAHTLRHRLDAFARAVAAQDPTAVLVREATAPKAAA